MNSHDMERLKECWMILCRVRDQLIKRANHCHDDKARDYLNEVAAEINNHTHNLRKQYAPLEEKTNHDQQS